MSGDQSLSLEGQRQSKICFTVRWRIHRRSDPNLSTSSFTFDLRTGYRIYRFSTSHTTDDVCLHASRKKFGFEFDRLAQSVEERESVVAGMLSALEIPFSIDINEDQNENENISLFWTEVDPPDWYSTENLHGGLNDVVMRISEVAARVVGDAAVGGWNRAEMVIMIEKSSIVPHEEYERLACSASITPPVEYVEDEDEEDEEGEEDDSGFFQAVEQSLLWSAERSGSVPPADEAVVAGLERLIRDEGSSDDDDDDDGSKEVKTCVICMEEVMTGSQLIRMPCSHLFHEDCVVRWLRKRNACPSCRFSLPSTTVINNTH